MTASWVAGTVRARALARRRIGATAARDLAARATAAEAVQVLVQTPYGHDVHPHDSLAAALLAASDVKAWAKTALTKDVLDGLTEAQRERLRSAYKARISTPAEADLSEVEQVLADCASVDDVDRSMRAYEAGAAIGSAPLWADLHPGDRERLVSYAVSVKETLAETRLGEIAGGRAA